MPNNNQTHNQNQNQNRTGSQMRDNQNTMSRANAGSQMQRDNAEQQLTLLARHTDLLLLPLSDPLDRALPAAGLLRFTQNGAQLELDSHNGDLRQAYRNQALAREARWQRLAQKLGVPLLPLSTQLELVEQLLRLRLALRVDLRCHGLAHGFAHFRDVLVARILHAGFHAAFVAQRGFLQQHHVDADAHAWDA